MAEGRTHVLKDTPSKEIGFRENSPKRSRRLAGLGVADDSVSVKRARSLSTGVADSSARFSFRPWIPGVYDAAFSKRASARIHDMAPHALVRALHIERMRVALLKGKLSTRNLETNAFQLRLDNACRVNRMVEAVEKEAAKRREECVTCRICYAERMSVVFEPCGHVLACVACASKLDGQSGYRCPVCRSDIKAAKSIHIC